MFVSNAYCASLSNVDPQDPNYIHIILDECPDFMDLIIVENPHEQITTITDDFWTTKTSFFLGYSTTQIGNFHNIPNYPWVTIHVTPEDAGQALRTFGYDFPGKTADFVVILPTVHVNEPSSFLLSGCILAFSGMRRKFSSGL